jgi:hypothetical protein
MEIILMIDFFLFSFYDQIKFEKKRHYLWYNLIEREKNLVAIQKNLYFNVDNIFEEI